MIFLLAFFFRIRRVPLWLAWCRVIYFPHVTKCSGGYRGPQVFLELLMLLQHFFFSPNFPNSLRILLSEFDTLMGNSWFWSGALRVIRVQTFRWVKQLLSLMLRNWCWPLTKALNSGRFLTDVALSERHEIFEEYGLSDTYPEITNRMIFVFYQVFLYDWKLRTRKNSNWYRGARKLRSSVPILIVQMVLSTYARLRMQLKSM